MTRRPVRYLGFLIAVALVGGVAGPMPALAATHLGSPDSTFAIAYLDSSRCRVLTRQVDQLKSAPGLRGKAASIAAQGAGLCQSGSFAAGADRLAAAVRMSGAVPAEPQPIIPLH